ncbi:hypothetical protein [Rhodococcus rhodochrous]|uniref:hypothetical protein n=1 Tax=Rhodococcus rhodochrous TaxID=1829 RepID=UPI001787605B|nr:hypothetical protein [Rhodococcus rhodochrous]QOH59428.1 hypothetical protein C6Y44_25305 [Rhodococcus rhodochrous]
MQVYDVLHAIATPNVYIRVPAAREAVSAMVQSVWAAAWKRAAEQADEATAVALDAARAGEADALTAAECAIAEKDDAVADAPPHTNGSSFIVGEVVRSAVNKVLCLLFKVGVIGV